MLDPGYLILVLIAIGMEFGFRLFQFHFEDGAARAGEAILAVN